MKRLARCLFFCACSVAVIWTFAARTDASGEVARETLTNGLKVVVVKNTLAPVVATVMNYLAGSNEAPPGFPGMAHAQEHMMFRGSPGLSQAQLANLIAAMGGNANADTQESITQYFFTVPAADLDIALHIEAIRMGGALDSEDLWRERAGRHRTGGGPGPFQPHVHLLRATPCRHFRRDPVCSQPAWYAQFLSANHRRHAQGFSSTNGIPPTTPSS